MQADHLAEEFTAALEAVDAETAEAYAKKLPYMTDRVNRELSFRDDLEELIGHNEPAVMHDNHHNHGLYMSSAFTLASGAGFVKTIRWVYRSYMARGFSARYFEVELEAWIDALDAEMPADVRRPITALYGLMLERHPVFVELSGEPSVTVPIPAEHEAFVQQYLAAVLKPSMSDAVKLCSEHIETVGDIQVWWQDIIRPAMHEIGRLWELGHLTVGREHLATSITQRVLALFYPKLLDIKRDKGTVILAATPGELHELGARMVADLLEIEGFDVFFTGANTPADSLIAMLRQYDSRVLCLSTTLSFHLNHVKSTIERIRDSENVPPAYIIVGGQAYADDSALWHKVGADGYASGVSEAAQLIAQRS